MSDFEKILERAMSDETKHWIEEATRYKTALEEIKEQVPKTHRDWQGTVALRIVNKALRGGQ